MPADVPNSNAARRYTLRGSDQIESTMASIVAEATAAVLDALPRCADGTLVLLGGYGRGEGGVERVDACGAERIEAGERPHNNLDLLWIAPGRSVAPDTQSRLDTALAPLRERTGIGLDVGVITAASLRRAPSLVMWYDMRHGHRTLAGDAGLVPSLRQFRVDRIPAWDVRNLMVNRGTLLVINDLVRAEQPAGRDRLLVRHAMKAIVGYGDALLYFLGRYHWSYAEKQRRMRSADRVDATFRRRYDEAIEFRFQPDYPRYLADDLGAWLDGVRTALEPVHLRCEQLRLGRPGLTWRDYLDLALAAGLGETFASPRRLARAALGFVEEGAPAVEGGAASRLAAKALGAGGVLPLLFPAVAYDRAAEAFGPRAAAALSVDGASPSRRDLQRAYLRAWGGAVDRNFAHVADRFGIALDGPTARPESETSKSDVYLPDAVDAPLPERFLTEAVR